MSNQATAEYYRMINDAVNERLGGWAIAEALIQCVNFGNIEYFVRNDKWEDARKYLEEKALGAQKGGADILICVSNTMHRVLDNIENVVDIPFIHIPDPTGEAIVESKLTTVGLIGTKPVMAADYISGRIKEKFGVQVVTPDEDEQVLVDNIIFDELVKRHKGKFKEKVYRSLSSSQGQRSARRHFRLHRDIFIDSTVGYSRQAHVQNDRTPCKGRR